MGKAGLDEGTVIERAAKLANEEGLERVTLKLLAEDLQVKSPSLYNYISGLDDLKEKIMLYGWKQMEHRIVGAVIGVAGYDAVRAACWAFYRYATENPGIFNAMLWYNKFQDEKSMAATERLFDILFRIMEPMHISRKDCNHVIRTFRGFLEGYALLVNNGAFGNPISIEESFELSLNVLIEGMKSLGRPEYHTNR